MYCGCYHSREMHHQTCVDGTGKQWPRPPHTHTPGILHSPARPPFVRRGTRTASLVKQITKTIRQRRFCVNLGFRPAFQSAREGSARRPNLDGGARASVNVRAADSTRTPSSPSQLFLLLRLSVSLSASTIFAAAKSTQTKNRARCF